MAHAAASPRLLATLSDASLKSPKLPKSEPIEVSRGQPGEDVLARAVRFMFQPRPLFRPDLGERIRARAPVMNSFSLPTMSGPGLAFSPEVRELANELLSPGDFGDPVPGEYILSFGQRHLRVGVGFLRVRIADGIWTSGATLLACASLAKSAFPAADVRAFAVLRTRGLVDEIETIVDPCEGSLMWNGSDVEREP